MWRSSVRVGGSGKRWPKLFIALKIFVLTGAAAYHKKAGNTVRTSYVIVQFLVKQRHILMGSR